MQHSKIWDKILNSDEKVAYEFSIAKEYRLFWIIVFCLIGILFIVGGMIGTGIFIILITLFYTGFYLKKSNVYAFTNRRVVVHRGWLSTKMISVEYDKITDVKVSESFLGRFLTSSGTLIINTAGSIRDEIVLNNVPSPYEIKKKLDNERLN